MGSGSECLVHRVPESAAGIDCGARRRRERRQLQVMQCNGEAVLVVIHGNNNSTVVHTTEARPALLWEMTSITQARLHSNLPWPMALAASTKDGQAQSRGVAVGFARVLALALARSLLLACLHPLLWRCVRRSPAVACGLALCAVVIDW